jgi:hypothetical protein
MATVLLHTTCPNCLSADLSTFYEAEDVPVHSVLLLPTYEEAVTFPKGRMVLGFCQACGFIGNQAFEPELLAYSTRYEETQGFSSTFNAFHRQLAVRLVERFDLHDKALIEIGCGKGEFLTLLCELGPNRGTGFDPAYVPERNVSPTAERLTFIQDFYSEKYACYQADFVYCKMTLEHIPNTADFINTINAAIGAQTDTMVFFQVPDVRRILRELAFWDIYYEHCSYFSLGSLARLFRRCGFEVRDLRRAYDDQYLMLEAQPSQTPSAVTLPQEQDLDALRRDVGFFAQHYANKIDTWRNQIAQMQRRGERVVIWGAGSKGVTFFNTLGIHTDIAYAVDINPHKHGTYMAGTGQEIVGPDFLKDYRPDAVIVMNPIYREEIRQMLAHMDLTPELYTL